MTTDTPRMDAIRRNAQSLDYDENGDVVMLEDARTLERELAGCRHAVNTYISRIAELKSELAEARISPSISPKWRIAELECERDGWKEREAQAHRLLDIAERDQRRIALDVIEAAAKECEQESTGDGITGTYQASWGRYLAGAVRALDVDEIIGRKP